MPPKAIDPVPARDGRERPRDPANTKPVTTVKEYEFVPSAKLPEGQRHGRLQGAGEQHGPLRTQRLGRLGADHLCQQRTGGRQSLEDARQARNSAWNSC